MTSRNSILAPLLLLALVPATTIAQVPVEIVAPDTVSRPVREALEIAVLGSGSFRLVGDTVESRVSRLRVSVVVGGTAYCAEKKFNGLVLLMAGMRSNGASWGQEQFVVRVYQVGHEEEIAKQLLLPLRDAALALHVPEQKH